MLTEHSFSLQSAAVRAILILGLAGLSLPLVAVAVRLIRAEQIASSGRLEDLVRASKVDPANPDYKYRAGYLYLWQEMDTDRAVNLLKSAVALNPGRPEYWIALGGACQVVLDAQCADHAFATVTRLAPAVPHYRWDVATFHLISGHHSEAVADYRVYASMQPREAWRTFSALRHAGDTPQQVWDALVRDGDNETLRLPFLFALLFDGDSEDAFRFWQEIARSRPAPTLSAVRPYLDKLIETGNFGDAVAVWRDLQRLAAIPAVDSKHPGNVVYNGSFDHDPLNGGFDWHFRRDDYVSFDLHDGPCFQPERCLRIDFNVPTNNEYEPVYQLVPVDADTSYILTARVKSVDLKSDSGPRFRVQDPECPSCAPEESEGVVGTTDWREVSVGFHTGPRARVVRLALWRPRSRSYPMEIQGSFWVDSVLLQRGRAGTAKP